MKQTLVISPTIIDTLLSFSPEDFRNKVLQRLPDYVYIFDKDRELLGELGEAINAPSKAQVHPQTLDWLRVMYRLVSDESRPNPAAQCAKRPSEKWGLLETEKEVLQEQLWKIILADSVSPSIQEEVQAEGIEISSVANFLAPSCRSMIRRPETVSKKKGETFDIVSWIMKYIKDADKILIEDPYLGAWNSLVNLENILKKLSPSTSVTLRGRKRHMNTLEQYADIPPIDSLKELASQLRHTGVSVQIIAVRDEELSDRSITTDDYDINFGHALGNVDPRTFYVKKQFKATVLRRQY